MKCCSIATTLFLIIIASSAYFPSLAISGVLLIQKRFLSLEFARVKFAFRIGTGQLFIVFSQNAAKII
jgi:hypothetical protein